MISVDVYARYIFTHTKPSPRFDKTQSACYLIDTSIHFGLNQNVCHFCSRWPLVQGSTECVSPWFQFSVLALISHSGISSSSTVCYCKAAVALSAVSVCVRACACLCVSRYAPGWAVFLSIRCHIALCGIMLISICVCVCVLLLSVGVNLYLF